MPSARKTSLVLSLITVAALALFLNKAFYIDDPLFIWIAQQIVRHPLDPYGFSVNWSSFAQPMSEVMQNPPLCSYYIAAIGASFGWSEIVLHMAFLLWPVLSVLGTFALARRFCREAWLAALLALFTPVVLISATSIMCDSMMLALWVWTIEWWLRGLDGKAWPLFFAAAGLASAATLTKYFAITLIPLLALYTFVRIRRFHWSLAFLLIPLAIVSNYDFLTADQYGRGLFTAALGLSSSVSSATRQSLVAQTLMGLAFGGGCFLTVLLFVRPDRAKYLIAFAAVAILFALGFKFLIVSWVYLEGSEWPVWIEGGLFAAAGVALLTFVILSFVGNRNSESLLLSFWIVGTFAFAIFFNWSITARTFLPAAPALAILAVQQFEKRETTLHLKYGSIAAAAFISLLLAIADYTQAGAARNASDLFRERYRTNPQQVHFLGHWGFQFYMEQWGAKPFDRGDSKVSSGEILVAPAVDPTASKVQIDPVGAARQFEFPVLPFMSTARIGRGGSFYSSFGGPLPWVVRSMPPEKYYAVTAR